MFGIKLFQVFEINYLNLKFLVFEMNHWYLNLKSNLSRFSRWTTTRSAIWWKVQATNSRWWSNGKQLKLLLCFSYLCFFIFVCGFYCILTFSSGDHIVPNFEEIWPSDKNKDDKYKRRLIGMEYYMDVRNYLIVCVFFLLRKEKKY